MDEKYYKNFIREHNKNVKIFEEYPIGKARADLLLVSKDVQVFEIKSDLDSLKRLNRQINEYYQVFDLVYVVCGPKHKKALIEKFQYSKVGLLVIENGEITYRHPANKHNVQLNRRYMYNLLRKYEFTAIIMQEFGHVPNVGDFEYYEACYKYLDVLSMAKLQWWITQKLLERK